MTARVSRPKLKAGRKSGPRITCICIHCNGIFQVPPWRVRQSPPLFCKNACRWAHDRERAFDPQEVEARFREKLIIPDDPDACWGWSGATTGFGYGHFGCGPRNNQKFVRAHTYSFVLHGGTLTPEKPCVLHRCDNPPCANPRHLFAGSKKDNTQDMMSKGRHRYIIPENRAHSYPNRRKKLSNMH